MKKDVIKMKTARHQNGDVLGTFERADVIKMETSLPTSMEGRID